MGGEGERGGGGIEKSGATRHGVGMLQSGREQENKRKLRKQALRTRVSRLQRGICRAARAPAGTSAPRRSRGR
jgi:hypothetical protein